MPRSEGIETPQMQLKLALRKHPERMPRSEGIETSFVRHCAKQMKYPERMPRSEGIETKTGTTCKGFLFSPGTNAPIRGD